MDNNPESFVSALKEAWPAGAAIIATIAAFLLKFKPIVSFLPKIYELGKTLLLGPTKILAKMEEQDKQRLADQENVLKRLGEQDAKISENLTTVIKRLDNQDEKLLSMSKELSSNGGSSVKDHIKETYNLAIMTQAVTQSIFYNNHVPSFECEPLEGLCSRCNTALEEQWGLNENEMKGKGWLSAVIGDAKEKNQIWDNYQESLKLEVPYSAEYHIYNRRTKEKITVRVNINPLKDNKGKILLYQGTSSLAESGS